MNAAGGIPDRNCSANSTADRCVCPDSGTRVQCTMFAWQASILLVESTAIDCQIIEYDVSECLYPRLAGETVHHFQVRDTCNATLLTPWYIRICQGRRVGLHVLPSARHFLFQVLKKKDKTPSPLERQVFRLSCSPGPVRREA